MSFVTVFTAGALTFVLLVPTLMILTLSTMSPVRRAVADAMARSTPDREIEPSGAVSRAA